MDTEPARLFAKPENTKNNRMKLRPYQLQILAEIRQSMALKERGSVIKLSTGAGKTAIFCTILSGYHRVNRPAMMMVRGVKLVDQASSRLEAMGVAHDIWQGAASVRSGHPVVIASVDTLVARCKPREDGREREPLPPAEILIIDECFSGDCEILTDKGFVRFDQLNETEIVAQFDQRNLSISFVDPIRFVKKHVENRKMVQIVSDNNFDLLTTENHEYLLQRPDGRFFKREAKNVKGANYIYKAGFSQGKDDVLTNSEKLAIAFQADGSNHSLNQAHFSFSKPNKIKEFLSLMKAGEFSFKEISGRPEKGNIKARRRFSVRMPFKTKNLWDIFDLKNISWRKCRAILEYMAIWDGHILPSNQLYFSSVDERNVDFYQSVAILAGYSSRKTKQIDNRKDTYNDVYRLYISKNKARVSTQGIKKKVSLHTGYVYCVTVPSGNIIVRRNGKVAVCGNCHLARSPGFDWVLSQYPNAYKALFSATPNHPRGFDDIADRLINPIGIQALIDQGYLVGGKYFVPDIPDLSGVKKTGGDFNEKQLSAVMADGTKTHSAAKVWRDHCRGKPTLVYATTVAHARALWEAFEAEGASAQVLTGETPREARNQAIAELSAGTLDAIISVGVLTTGVDIPPLRAIICCRPTESYNLWVQILGRGTRIHPGKENFEVYDLAGNLITHGTIEDEKESYLNAQEAKKAKKEKSDTKILAICQKCYATFEYKNQDKCISCGADLVNLRKKKVGKRIATMGEQSDVKEYVKQEWEKYFDEVLAQALSKKWKKGAVFFKMAERYGEAVATKAFNKIKGRKNWPKRSAQ